MAIPDRGQSFDAEEKGVRVGSRIEIGNRAWLRHIENGEEQVDDDITAEEKKSEARPAQRQHPVITVAPATNGGVDLEELGPASAGGDRTVRPLFHLLSYAHDRLDRVSPYQ